MEAARKRRDAARRAYERGKGLGQKKVGSQVGRRSKNERNGRKGTERTSSQSESHFNQHQLVRRVLNNHGMEPRARLCRLSFSSPSRRTQAGIPREMFYSGTPRAPARAGTSCCPSIRRLNAPAQVAATAICIQSTLQFGPRKRKGAPTSPYIRNNVRTPIRRDITRDRS